MSNENGQQLILCNAGYSLHLNHQDTDVKSPLIGSFQQTRPSRDGATEGKPENIFPMTHDQLLKSKPNHHPWQCCKMKCLVDKNVVYTHEGRMSHQHFSLFSRKTLKYYLKKLKWLFWPLWGLILAFRCDMDQAI